MVAGWGLEPGNSLLYLRWEVRVTLSIHLLFDLQKMMHSVLHAEHEVNLCIQVFYLFVAFPPLFIEAPATAGSSASTKNLQQGLHWKLSVQKEGIFHEERKQIGGLTSRAHITLQTRPFGDLGRSWWLQAPASPPCVPGQAPGEQGDKAAGSSSPAVSDGHLSDPSDGAGLSEGAAEGGLCVSDHGMRWGVKGGRFHIFLWLAELEL